MKKQVLIIVSVVIVLILILVWTYLLFFGTPKSVDSIFTEFGKQGSEDTSLIVPPENKVVESSVVNNEKAKLRQLTLKPVAGFREIINESSSQSILYYVEAGTGHIYSIDLNSGEEIRISGTTIPQAYEAAISAKGDFIAITSVSNAKDKLLVLGSISTSSNSFTEKFSEIVQDFSFGNSDELLYSVSETQGLSAYSYNLKTGVRKNIFSLPFHEATIQWGTKASGTHYAFPNTSYALEGFLYEINNGKLNRLPLDGFGFSALANKEMVLFTAITNEKPTSFVYDRKTGVKKILNTVVIPEKCSLSETGVVFYCAHEPVTVPYQFPDEWYMGVLSFKDSLWEMNATEFTSTKLVDTLTESGRELDGINLSIGTSTKDLYFINKNDNTLWTYAP